MNKYIIEHKLDNGIPLTPAEEYAKKTEEMVAEFGRFTIMDGNRILLHGNAEEAEDWLRIKITTLQSHHEEEVKKAIEVERARILSVLESEGYIRGCELIAHDDSKKSHGSCCYCSTCGHDNDSCVCEHNRLLQAITPITNKQA